ncbi:hypothetical protein [Tumebacillus sp. BK434]|uniref:hypothetical protein n=1 Tax=Tumebacillus sp. BK434 TaxID=2512169 RepID=UPI00104F08BB|nr:hypothetical protein [Tumebacillus sp. BK434]
MFRSRMKRTAQEINLLPKRVQVLPDAVHHLVGKPLSYIHRLAPLPESLFGTRSVVMLLSTTCPYCPTRLEEFMEQYLPYNPVAYLCLIQAEEDRELEKFGKLYPGLPMLRVTRQALLDLQLDEFPNFLMVGEDGRIEDCVSRAQFLPALERR